MCDLQFGMKGGTKRITNELYLLIVIVSMAVYWDIRCWRIPNIIIVFGFIHGYIITAIRIGPRNGLIFSLIGTAIPIVSLIILFLIKALGAGDIKLLAVIGTFVGSDVVRVIEYSFFAGGVISLIYLLRQIYLSFTDRKQLSKTGFYRNMRRRVHFSIAIMIGIVCYALDRVGR